MKRNREVLVVCLLGSFSLKDSCHSLRNTLPDYCSLMEHVWPVLAGHMVLFSVQVVRNSKVSV